MHPVKAIPEKLFFKIGEVCDLVGVEPHVLRYWEKEFPMLAPQKNRAGQRVYRRKDVEIIMRIKQLRDEEGYTIAGTKKKLSVELRGGAKLKVVTPEMVQEARAQAQTQSPQVQVSQVQVPQVQVQSRDLQMQAQIKEPQPAETVSSTSSNETAMQQQRLLRKLRKELQGLLTMLSRDDIITE